MQQRHSGDRLACRGAPQAANSILDSGIQASCIRRRLTSGLGAAQVARVASPTQSIAARNRQAHDARSPAVRKTLAVVLLLNAIVLAIKIVVGIRTGALTVLGAALESGLDVLNNVIGIALVAVASRAPDEDHPYGHDKFETLGALGIVGFLSISCFELLRAGADALLARRPPHHVSLVDIAFIIATLVVNVFVVWYERRRGRELGSVFLMADAAHTSGDILVTLMALGSLALARIGWPVSTPHSRSDRADHRMERVQILRDSIPCSSTNER